jgi:hypothetical protein
MPPFGPMRQYSRASGASALEFGRPDLARDLIKHAIYDARLVFVEKEVSDIDILVDHDARRNVVAIQNFRDTGTQYCPQD